MRSQAFYIGKPLTYQMAGGDMSIRKWMAVTAAAVFLCFGGVPVQGAEWRETENDAVSAKGCVVMEAGTGRILYAYHPDTRLPMASTTKIMTTLIALEQPDLDTYFTVDKNAIQVEGSSMGLKEGDQVTLRGLCYGMMLPSGNDAANAAAVRIAGSKEAFAERMNQKAEELGLTNTHFVTPSGLDDPNHYSTAYDMARLAAYALEDPQFREICSQYKASVEYGSPPYKRWMTNHNKLLQMYEGTIGVKTGFTDSAGRCLVSAAQRGEITLICVTLGAADDWNLHQKLYDRYFTDYALVDLTAQAEGYTIPVVGGQSDEETIIPAHAVRLPFYPEEQDNISCEIECPAFLYAPVEKGEVLGNAVYKKGDTVLYEVPLIAQETILAEEKKGFWQKLKEIFEDPEDQ